MENQGRRKFLKHGLVATGALVGSSVAGLLQGCASVDRLILSGQARDPNEVIILGGGLAGLATAYYCKKNSIPFVLFEASSRIGGRVLTLADFNSLGQPADLGGEWILPSHESLLSLCRELNVELNENTWAAIEVEYFDNGKRSLNPLLRKELRDLSYHNGRLYADLMSRGNLQLTRANRDSLPRAVFQDSLSVEEYLAAQNLKLSATARTLIRSQVRLAFGAEPTQVSSLQWLARTAKSQDLMGLEGHRFLKVSGGSSVLAQALHDRVAGVIPGRYVRRSHVLRQIHLKEGVFELQFQTPQGPFVYTGKRIVSTLPLGVLQELSGVAKLPFTDRVLEYLGAAKMGQLSKGAFAFSERPWRKANVSRFMGSFDSQIFWESEPTNSLRYQSLSTSQKAILSFQIGGEAALATGLHSLVAAEKDLQNLKFFSGRQGVGQIQNWGLMPYSKGALSYFSPGQLARFGGILSEPELDGQWLFAGEGISLLSSGTMNGAVESAQQVVQRLLHQGQKAEKA